MLKGIFTSTLFKRDGCLHSIICGVGVCIDSLKKSYLVSRNGQWTTLEERGEYKDRKKETVFKRQVGMKIEDKEQREQG
jgi:hypothetical protein